MSEWQPVTGWEGRYEVSAKGEIRKMNGEIVGQWPNDQGYMLVRLSAPRRMVRVNRIVATAFVPNPKSLPVVNHIDFDRANDCASNLEWCTQAENLEHSEKSGRMQRDYWTGKRSPNAKLSDDQVNDIKRAYKDGEGSHQSLANQYGTSKRTIGRILKGEYYA